MREIKFRAWVDGFDTPFLLPSADWSLSLLDTGHKVLMWCSDGLVDEFPTHTIEQYTGLKDKNGVEIYEGDVLDNERVKFVAVWKDDDGYWGADVINDQKHIPEDYLLCQYGAAYEVIGNIHENPELLEAGHGNS